MNSSNSLPSILLYTLDQALLVAQDLLIRFTYDTDFARKLELVFGNQFNITQAQSLIQDLAASNSSVLPKIEIRTALEINGARGAFSGQTNTIYIAQEFLEANVNNIPEIATVLIEELGHAIDFKINATDTRGDEGELFSDLVRGVELSEGEIHSLKEENDLVTVTLDGQNVQLEQANYNLGLVAVEKFVNESIFFGDQDFFTFQISSPGQSENFVGIASDSQSVDLILELYNQSGSFVRGSNNYDYTYNLEIVSLDGLPAGIYTARVYDYFGGFYVQPFAAPYILGINPPQPGANAGVEIQESNAGTNLSEAGTTDTYTVVLKSQPTANVTINIAADNQSTITPTSVTFTPSNWNTPKTVTVRAVDDSVVEGNHTTTIAHTVVSGDSRYNGIPVDPIVAAIADNDTRTIVIQEQGNINVTEGGSTVQNAYFVQLLSTPNSPVTVTIRTDSQTTATSSLARFKWR